VIAVVLEGEPVVEVEVAEVVLAGATVVINPALGRGASASASSVGGVVGLEATFALCTADWAGLRASSW
jgi:hypothetical protein